jgi:2,3-bisphosphoglycerate-independent phosphoglycerate mutase
MGLLGYHPPDHFPLERAIFEAHAIGVKLTPGDVAFRCNIAAVSDDDILTDFTAGQISDQDAYAFLESINMPNGYQIKHDLSYRNVLVDRDSPLDVNRLTLFEPHENVGEPIQSILPAFDGEPYQPLIDIMLASRQNGKMLWPWGQVRSRTFEPMPWKVLTVTALSFLVGMTEMLGGTSVKPPGSTGYINTDLKAKLKALTDHLDSYDVAFVHGNAPDEEAHLHHYDGKSQSIANIDRDIVSPLIDFLEGRADPYRLIVIPDHYTCCGDGKHTGEPVPYAVMGTGIKGDHGLTRYSEAEITAHCQDQEHLPAENLINHYLNA